MTRSRTLSILVGALLVGVLGAPALADPLLSSEDNRETVCVRTEGNSGAREGVCVWVPIPR